MARIQLVIALLAVALLAACSSTPKPTGPTSVPMNVSQRPDWTNKEPEADGNNMVFVGISNPYATERGARDDAMRDATQRVVDYLGTAAEDKFQQASTSFGLSSSVVDPTQATRSFQQQLSGNVARRLRAREWYTERQTSSTGTGYVVFVKSEIPTSSINEAFQQTAQDNLKAAQERARQAATDQAKQQADQAAQFWANMAKQGLVPDNGKQ